MSAWLTVIAGYVIGIISGKDLLSWGWVTAALCAVMLAVVAWNTYREHLEWRKGMSDHRDIVQRMCGLPFERGGDK